MLCEIKGGSHTIKCTVEQRFMACWLSTNAALALQSKTIQSCFAVGSTIRVYLKAALPQLVLHVATSPRCKPESSHKVEATLNGVKKKLRTRVETYLSSQDSMAQAAVSPEGRASSPSCL